MTCFKCQFGAAVKLTILLVASTISTPADGQGTKRGKELTIPGESVSPQLTGKVLQVLFDGVADLYFLADNKECYYYITDRNGRLFTLAIPQRGKGEGQDATNSWREGVIPVLKVVMQDAPMLYERIESCNPVKYELIDLMHDYHVAIEGSVDGIEYELPPPAFLPYIGFYAGCNADFLKADNSDNLSGFKMDPAVYPSAGISFTALLPRISQNLSLTLDLSVGKRYVYGYYKSGNHAPPVTTIYYELHLHDYLIMTDLQVGYNFGSGHIRPYASGGICTRTVISDNSRIDSDVCYEGLIISDSFDYRTEEKTSLGVIMSLGFSFDISREVFLTTAIHYSELFVSPSYGSYRSAGLKIGANF